MAVWSHRSTIRTIEFGSKRAGLGEPTCHGCEMMTEIMWKFIGDELAHKEYFNMACEGRISPS